LVGIVVNAAILMVELANQIGNSQAAIAQSAMLRAAPQRLRPIVMTTVTTDIRFIPAGAGNWGRFGISATIGIVVFPGWRSRNAADFVYHPQLISSASRCKLGLGEAFVDAGACHVRQTLCPQPFQEEQRDFQEKSHQTLNKMK
jgi:hypothetical protein